VNEHLEVRGDVVWNERFKKEQIKASSLIACPPTTIEGIEKYLGSGIIPGIGPHLAQKLIEFGGSRIFDIISNEPQTLGKIPGIGKKKLDKIIISCQGRQELQKAITFLYSFGLGASQAASVFKKFRDRTIEIVRTDPYVLVREIQGIGFKTADAFALKLGVVPFASERIRQGLLFCLETSAQQAGHCALPKEELSSRTGKLLSLTEEPFITPQIEEMIKDEELIEDLGLVFHPQAHKN